MHRLVTVRGAGGAAQGTAPGRAGALLGMQSMRILFPARLPRTRQWMTSSMMGTAEPHRLCTCT
jgi:hypothetical protein